MRRCLLGDLVAAATAVAAQAAAQQPAFAHRLISEADAAHRYHKRFGLPHPTWGNGSLMARALAELQPPVAVSASSAAFLSALGIVAQLLATRKQSFCAMARK